MKKKWERPELKKVQVKKITLSGSGHSTECGDPINANKTKTPCPAPN